MVNLLSQVVLAARHQKEPDWMQFLIFGLVAVFWVISGIIKAKSGKAGSEQRRGKTAIPRRPRQKPTIHPKAVKTLRPEMPKRQRYPISQPRKATVETGQLQREIIPESVQPVPETKEKLKDNSLGMQDIDLHSRRAEPARWEFEFDDKKKLKRAIIYREILGKPLSLRGGDNW